jgi:hypothetical protein
MVEYHLLGYNAVYSVESQPTFRWNISPPSSETTVKAELCLSPAFTLVSCSAYSSILKMEAISSTEMSVDFQRTARRYIPEDSTLRNKRCENLKPYRILPDTLFATNIVVPSAHVCMSVMKHLGIYVHV